MALSPHALTFCLLSFEGPDRYALAGGLGVRITHLAETLARRGFETHLFFVGDRDAPGYERHLDGRLILHRWCQWISAYHPTGVYEAEDSKVWDFSRSAPPFIIEHIVRPAVAAGRLPVIMAEEWHTTEALIRLDGQLRDLGLRRHCVLFWNANNTMSFHRVDWPRLNAAAQLTTVSRYMKHLMWDMKLNPLVIPNGIPADLLETVDVDRVASLAQAFSHTNAAVMLFKVGRFDPAKRWLMAMEAAAQLKARGHRVIFPLRGGIESHQWELLGRARELGLYVTDVNGQPTSWDEVLGLLHSVGPADVYNLRFYLSQDMLRPFYAAADAVLANSGHEPFGLVGLEAMAAGGVVFTGMTGEDYAFGGRSAVMLDTDRPEEIVSQILELQRHPERVEVIRRTARECAAAFTWDQIVDVLLEKVAFVAQYPTSTGSTQHPHD